MKRSDLIGIEVVINNADEAKQFSHLCSDYGIYQGDWSGCSYTDGTMRGLVSLDKGTNDSCKLVFTTDTDDEDTMIEFCNLRKVDLYSLLQPEPQFQNGDTVYDEDGVAMMYATVHPLLPDTSVLLNSLGELTAIRTNKLTTKPPVTPKDGEWWMCDIDGNSTAVLPYMKSGWDIYDVKSKNIKPLYRMIRDTNTDTE